MVGTVRRFCVAAIFSFSSLCALAQSAGVDLRIPPGELGPALKAYSRATGVDVNFSDATVQGLKTQGVEGHLAPKDALARLLEGTGLEAVLTGPTSVAVTKPRAARSVDKPATQEERLSLSGTSPDAPKSMAEMTVEDDAIDHDYYKKDAHTGTKTDTPLMETPLNVQVVSQQLLEDQQAVSMQQALKNVSGIYFMDGQTTFSGTRSTGIVLRGFQVGTYYADGARVEGGYYGSSDVFSSRQMANVDSVEVLKGPAAILYGLLEPGGLVNVVKKQPSATPGYAASQQIGEYKYYRTDVGLTGPLNNDQTITYRLDSSYESNGAPFGYPIDFVSSQDVFIAPVIRWNINRSNSVQLELEHNQLQLGTFNALYPIYNGQWVNIPSNINYGERSPEQLHENRGALNWEHKFNNDWSLKQKLFYGRIIDDTVSVSPNNLWSPYLGQAPTYPWNYTIQLIPAGQPIYEQLFGGNYQIPTLSYGTNTDVTGHFHLFGTDHTLLLGENYYWERSTVYFFNKSNNFDTFPFPTHQIIPGPCFNCGSSSAEYESNDGGVYIQDQIKLPGNVFFLIGERYSHLRQAQTNSGNFPNIDIRTPIAIQKTWGSITPRLGALWQARDGVSLYANFAEGMGSNVGGIVYPGYYAPPTDARTWEVGVKFEPVKDKFILTAAYYDLDKTNQTENDPIAWHNPYCGGQCSILIGETLSRGYELDAQGTILPGWQMNTNYSYSHIVVAGGGGWQPWIPQLVSNVWTTYEFQRESLKGWKIGAGFHHIGQRAGESPINPWMDPYSTWDLMTAYERKLGAHGKLTLQVNGTNVFNNRALNTAWSFGSLGPGYSLQEGVHNYIPARMVTGLVKVEY